MSKLDANTETWNEKCWLRTGAQFTWGLIGPQNPVPICGLWFSDLAFRNLNPGCLKAQIWNLLHLPQATIFTRPTIEMQVGLLGLTLLTLLPMASGERVMWGMRVIQNNCGNAVTSKSGLRILPTWFIGLSGFCFEVVICSPCNFLLVQMFYHAITRLGVAIASIAKEWWWMWWNISAEHMYAILRNSFVALWPGWQTRHEHQKATFKFRMKQTHLF